MANPIDIILRLFGAKEASAETKKVTAEISQMGAAAQHASAAAQATSTKIVQGSQQAAKAVGLARHEFINLSYQIQDVGVGLVSGQSPFIIMVQQGSQVLGVLSASKGGISGALADIRNKIAGLPNAPFAGWAVGITAAVTATAALIIKIGELQAKMQESTSLEGIQKQSSGRISPLAAAIQDLASNKTISTDEKESLQRALSQAAGLDVSSKDGVLEQQQRIQEVFRRVQAIREAAGASNLQVELAQARGQQQIDQQIQAGQLADAKASYEAQTTTLEQYLAKRREIAELAHANERTVSAAELKAAEQAVAGASADSYSAAKSRLEELKLSIIAQQRGYENELSEITREGLDLRAKELEKAAKDEEQRLKELADFKRRLEREETDALRRLARERAEAQRAARSAFQNQTGVIGSDFRLTSPERYNALLAAAEAAAKAGTITREEFERFKAQLGPDPTSWLDQWTNGFNRLADSWGTLQQSVVNSSLGLINSGVDALASGIGRAIVVTGNLKQAWADVKVMVLQTLAQEIIGYGIRRGLALAWKALTSGLRTADTAETVAAEGTKAAAAAPAATLLSISSYGLAAVIGIAAILGALAAVSFREHGGPVEAGRPYIVGEKRPELFIPSTSGMIVPRVPAPDYGGVSSGSTGGPGAAAPASRQGGSGVYVGVHGSMSEAAEGAVLSGALDAYIINLVDGRVRQFNPGA